jgi:hypothetical protein
VKLRAIVATLISAVSLGGLFGAFLAYSQTNHLPTSNGVGGQSSYSSPSAISSAPFSGRENPSWEYVHGYYRHNGTYVQGYHRTVPNSTKSDNYSTRGNANPWTGKAGRK